MIKDNKEPAFQLTWAILHLCGVLMHAGSAVYHLRRATLGRKDPPPGPD